MSIPTNSIGAQSFIRIDGVIPKKGRQLSDVTRPQVDGRAFRWEGDASDVGQIVAITDVDSAATAEALRASYAALQGTVVTIYREGIAHTNYLILKAELTDSQYVETAVGGLTGGDHIVASRFEIVYVGT